MSTQKNYPVPDSWALSAHINKDNYQTLYQQSIDDPKAFWDTQAKRFVTWFTPFENTLEGDFNHDEIRWFANGTLNASYNCIDRHLENKKNKIALLWEGNDPSLSKSYTYHELYTEVCRLANALKALNIKKGDRVAIYLPMIPEMVFSILACARIGAVHSVIFAGFSSEALKARILDADCKLLITADEGLRGDKVIALKKNSDEALKQCPNVIHSIVVQRTGNPIPWDKKRDIWYHEAVALKNTDCPAEVMDTQAPLFILYTSGSTGKPKGVLHSTGSYLVYAAMTYYMVFNHQDKNIHFCTADIGWITGHSYVIYGPLALGSTTLLFEGVPHYPTPSRYWEIIDKYQVTTFYTSPTALRSLRHEGDAWVTNTDRKSLTLLGTVGEPINPEVWEWYYHVVGNDRCPIVNTWWQTETGGIILTQFPGATSMIPGSVGRPFFGIVALVVDEQGNPVKNGLPGQLILKQPWPGLMNTIYQDHSRFINTYLHVIPGSYYTGDGAYMTEEGHFWITGRNDDVIKVSGHRIGTEELESAFMLHDAVSEAAAVGVPHDIKGECIYAFIVTKPEVTQTEELKDELIKHVRLTIGPLATPETIQWAKALPKTRSGKIMRRILRKIATHEFDDLGDTSTLSDEQVVKQLTLETT